MVVQVRERDTNAVVVRVTSNNTDVIYNVWVEGFRKDGVGVIIEVFHNNSANEPDETYESYR